MSLEKKLGLIFIGMLFVTFCGVLTMRLTDGHDDKPIDINVAGVAPEPSPPTTPQRNPQPVDRPTFLAERRDPPASNFIRETPQLTQAVPPYGAPPEQPRGATSSPQDFAVTAPIPAGGSRGDTRYATPAGVAGVGGIATSSPPMTTGPLSSSASTGVNPNPLRHASEQPVANAAPPTVPTSSAAPRAADDDRYAAPNIATSSTSGVAAREPRPFDTAAVPLQPLAARPAPAENVASPGVAALTPPATSPATTPSYVREPVPNVAGAPSPTRSPSGAVAPASAVAPIPSGRDQPYIVAPGDNLPAICEKLYGDATLYRALFAYNSDRYPHVEDIRTGSVLDVPPAEYLKQRYADMTGQAPVSDTIGSARPRTSGGTYTVREGDTLFDIARKQLGQAARWTELYEANRALLGENLENLRPGVTLRLP